MRGEAIIKESQRITTAAQCQRTEIKIKHPRVRNGGGGLQREDARTISIECPAVVERCRIEAAGPVPPSVRVPALLNVALLLLL